MPALLRHALLVTLLLMPLTATAAPDDAELSPRARARIKKAERIEADARGLMERGDAAGAEVRALEALDLKRKAVGAKHPVLGSAFLVLADAHLARVATKGGTQLERAQNVPRQEEAFLIRLYTRACELLEAQSGATHASIAAPAAVLTQIHGSFGAWHEAQRWAARCLRALGPAEAADRFELIGPTVVAAAGSGVMNATASDLVGFFGLTPTRFALAAYAERYLAHVSADASPLDKAQAMLAAAALWLGHEAKADHVEQLVEGALALQAKAGKAGDRDHGRHAAMLLAVHATDVGNIKLWSGRCQELLMPFGASDLDVLRFRAETLTTELPPYEAALKKHGPAHAKTWAAAGRLVQKLCSGRTGPEPGDAIWPSACRVLALRVARQTVAGTKKKGGALDQGRAHATLGLALMASGRFEEAQAAYDLALKRLDGSAEKSERADVRTAVGYLACLEDRIGDAHAAYEEAFKLRGGRKAIVDSAAFRLALNVAYLRAQTGNPAKATAALDAAIGAFEKNKILRAPWDQERWRFEPAVGVLLDLGRHADIARMTALLAEQPPSGSPHSPAAVLRHRGDFGDALAIERARLREYEKRNANTRVSQTSYDWALVRLRQARALLDVGAEDEAFADLLETIDSFGDGARQNMFRAQEPPRRTLLLGYEAIARAAFRRGMLDQARSFGRRAYRLHVSYAYAADRSRTPLFEGRPDVLFVRDVLERRATALAPLASRAPEVYARILQASEEGAEAVRILEDALLAVESRLPAAHPRAAVARHALARVFLAQGKPAQARPHAERAREILEAAVGAKHPEIADVLLTLGDLDLLEDKPVEALPRYARAAKIAEDALFPTHIAHALAASGAALALARTGQTERAVKTMRRALDAVAARVESRISAATNAERMGLLGSVHWALANWLEVTQHAHLDGYADVLTLKGRVVRAMGLEARLLRTAEGKTKASAERLEAARRRLARLAYRAPRFGWRRAAWRRDVAEASAQVEKLSRKLGGAYAALGKSRKSARRTPRDLSKRLSAGEALVDVLLSGGRYVAWVLAPKQEVQRLDLGPAAALDEHVQAFRDAVLAAEGRADEALLTSGAALRAAFWVKIAAALPADVSTVFLVPDGALAAAPLEALPGRQPGRFLIDDLLLVRVPFPHMLLKDWATPATGKGALLVGDVNFEFADRETKADGPVVTGKGKPLLDRVPGLRRLPALPGSAREIQAVQALLQKAGSAWRPEALLQDRATEGRVRTASAGKRIVHFATHGIVRAELSAKLRMPEESAFRLREGLERHVQGFDPMLMSGLALAGLNARIEEGEDDGLLTSLEVLGLDLDGVELAFLSACETARGVEQAGEGTLGLVQAFALAGARTVVASLWPVDDASTELLVRAFYATYVKGKTSAAEALRAAALALRDEHGRTAPRHWAAFGAYGR